MMNKFLRFLPPLLWMVVIFLFSSRPDLPKNEVIVLDFIIKKLAHFSEYFILVILWYRALGQSSLNNVFLVALIYAFTDEIHQLFVPGRTGTIRDIAIDGAGIITAYMLIKRVKLWKKS